MASNFLSPTRKPLPMKNHIPIVKFVLNLLVVTLVAGCGSLPGENSAELQEDHVAWEICGDGVLQSGEVCDDGDNNSDSRIGACRSDCSYLICGPTAYEALGLEGTTYCAEDLIYQGNARLENYSDIKNVDEYTRIEGNLVIAGAAVSTLTLENLRRIDGNLWIWDTGALENFEFASLEEIGGDILIRNNNKLADFGMGKLRSVGGNIAISFNSALPTCTAEDFTDFVGPGNIVGAVKIEGNKSDSCE